MIRAVVAAVVLLAGCDDGGSASEFPAESGAKYEGWAKCNTEPGTCPADWLCRQLGEDGVTYWTCLEPLGLGEDCREWPNSQACDCAALRRGPDLDLVRYCIAPCDEVQDNNANLIRLACPDGFTCAEDISQPQEGVRCYRTEDVGGLLEPRESRPL